MLSTSFCFNFLFNSDIFKMISNVCSKLFDNVLAMDSLHLQWIFSWSVIIWCVLWLHNGYAISPHPIVCVMAFDGFRPDYLHWGSTPILEQLSAHGVHSKYLKNVFPTKTYVNFFSMATGMYANKHGVLANSVFDTNGSCIGYSYEMFHANANITPIWILNEMSGNGRHSGVMMWAGEQYKYRNILPTFFQPYNKTIPWHNRIDMVIEWLIHDQTPANLLHVYFEQPDAASHTYGIKSEEVKNQLVRIETIVKYFLKSLSKHNIMDKINLIILSDHGMVDIDRSRLTDVSKILDPKSYIICGGTPVLQVKLSKGYEKEAYENLTNARDELKTFDVFKKDEIPQRWHYRDSKRVTNLLLVAKSPFAFSDEKYKANHGYDNEEPSMKAFFTAIGPLFKQKYYVKELQNIDIYALLAYIMQMDTSKLIMKPDATLNNILRILKINIWDDYQNHEKQKLLKYFSPKHKRNV